MTHPEPTPTPDAPREHTYVEAEPSPSGKMGWRCTTCGHYSNAPVKAKFYPCPGPTPDVQRLAREAAEEVDEYVRRGGSYIYGEPAAHYFERRRRELAAIIARHFERVVRERDDLRETVRRLNRRTQQAEAAVAEVQAGKHSRSLGRALLSYQCRKLTEERDAALKRAEDAERALREREGEKP